MHNVRMCCNFADEQSEHSALHFSFVLHANTSLRQTGKKDPAGLIVGEQASIERREHLAL